MYKVSKPPSFFLYGAGAEGLKMHVYHVRVAFAGCNLASF